MLLRELQDGFDRCGYTIIGHNQVPESAETNFPAEWEQTYFSNKFYEIDPVFDFAKQCDKVSGSKILTPPEMSSPLFEEARMFGADSNFISVSRIGQSTMVFGGVRQGIDLVSADQLHDDCRALHRKNLISRFEHLTDTQLDVLDLAEEGLLDKEIAAELGVTLSAIAQRKQGVCKRLNQNSFKPVLSLYSIWKWGGIAVL